MCPFSPFRSLFIKDTEEICQGDVLNTNLSFDHNNLFSNLVSLS